MAVFNFNGTERIETWSPVTGFIFISSELSGADNETPAFNETRVFGGSMSKVVYKMARPLTQQ